MIVIFDGCTDVLQALQHLLFCCKGTKILMRVLQTLQHLHFCCKLRSPTGRPETRNIKNNTPNMAPPSACRVIGGGLVGLVSLIAMRFENGEHRKDLQKHHLRWVTQPKRRFSGTQDSRFSWGERWSTCQIVKMTTKWQVDPWMQLNGPMVATRISLLT